MRKLLIAALFVSAPLAAQESVQEPKDTEASATVHGPYRDLCLGDACDAYLPILDKQKRYRDVKGQQRLGAALGGLSGALIGNEIGDAPGAVGLGLLGAALGYKYDYSDAWEKQAKKYDDMQLRGDEIYYNPANPLPLKAHWMFAGAGAPLPKQKGQ
jgi:uncharacterized protein YcfJ